MCLAVAGNKGLTQGVEYIGKASKKAKIVFL
jgi:hypothetical protein